MLVFTRRPNDHQHALIDFLSSQIKVTFLYSFRTHRASLQPNPTTNATAGT